MSATPTLALLGLLLAPISGAPTLAAQAPNRQAPAKQSPGAQAPDDVLARYTLRGAERTVTRTDVALDLAFHLRRRDRGRQGCEMLVDFELTRREAKRLDLMPTEAEVRAFWEKLKKQLIAAGRRPEEFAAVRNTGEKQWLKDLSVQLAQERLVRHELGLPEHEKVSGDMLRLWLGEAKKRVDVETDPGKLPVGVAARVGDTNLPLIDLGMLLLRTSEDLERDRAIRQLVYVESLEALAAERDVAVTSADLDRAIENRRQQAMEDPRYTGVSFEQLLEAQGLTVDSLRELRVFRSQVLLDKLALVEFPDAKLAAEIEADRDAVLAKVGPRRRIGLIFVRALDEPNEIVTRTFDDALAYLGEARARIARDGFATTAALVSEHGASKKRGGDVGWHRRSSEELPEQVRNAAFAMKMTDVSMPIRAEHGCFLVTVLDKEPTPDDDELVQRLRVHHAEALSEGLLRDANLRIVGAEDGDDAGTAAGGNAK